MDIDKILKILTLCTEKILSRTLSGDPKNIAFAFEYNLILLGERINEVIEEVERFVIKNRILFVEFFKSVRSNINQPKFESGDGAYLKRLFREAFNKTLIGSNLMLLNFMRNQLKHNFTQLTEEDHTKFNALHEKARIIQEFLELVRKAFAEEKSHEIIIKNIFNIKSIELFTATSEFQIVKEILKEPKTKKTETTFAVQQQKVLTRLERMDNLYTELATLDTKLNINYPPLSETDRLILHYAIAMCLIVIGEQATRLITYKKDKNFDESIKLELNKLHKTLGNLSNTSTLLTHPANEPKPETILKWAKSYLARIEEIKQLQATIKNLEKLKTENISNKTSNIPVMVEKTEDVQKTVSKSKPNPPDINKTQVDKIITNFETTASVELNNLATQAFLGDGSVLNPSHLEFNTWYHPDICHYLLQLIPNQAKCIRVILPDAGYGDNTQTFKDQLQQLVLLGNALQHPAIFISKEPGADNHYICGLIKQNKLLLINPLGVTDKRDCYQTLSELKREGTISEIWLSNNSLQKHDYENTGLVSCGPITLELAIHILTHITPEMLEVFWLEQLKSNEPTTHEQSGLICHSVNITALLPETLKALEAAADRASYIDKACLIRKRHFTLLQNLPTHRAQEEGSTTDAYLKKCNEGASSQVLFNAMVTQHKNINTLNELREYQFILQELNQEVISPVSSFNDRPNTPENMHTILMTQLYEHPPEQSNPAQVSSGVVESLQKFGLFSESKDPLAEAQVKSRGEKRKLENLDEKSTDKNKKAKKQSETFIKNEELPEKPEDIQQPTTKK